VLKAPYNFDEPLPYLGAEPDDAIPMPHAETLQSPGAR